MALEMKYFVLKPRGKDVYAIASRNAMMAYASTLEEEDPTFGKELRAWARDESTKVLKELGIKGIE